MAHSAKYTASASGHLAKHYERAKNEQGEYIKFGNQNIDTSRSHLNYNLAPEREGGQVAFIKQRTSEVRCLKRDDVKVMCSWVVTLPKYEWHDKKIHMSANKEKVEQLFFERAYRFMADRYGEGNVISAYVHKDEVTPHIHFAFIPIVKDKKRGGEKVSAKDVLTIHELRSFHTDLERHLDSFKDWHFEVINEATKDGNKTVEELKVETAHQNVVEAENKALEAQEKVNVLETQKKALLGEIEALQTTKDTLTTQEVKNLKASKTLTGALKGVNYKEFEALKRTAEQVDVMSAEVERANARATAAERRAADAEQRAENVVANANAQLETLKASANRQLAEKSQALERERAELRAQKLSSADLDSSIEIARLKEQIQRQQTAIQFLLDFVKEKIPAFFKTAEQKVRSLIHGKETVRRSKEKDISD